LAGFKIKERYMAAPIQKNTTIIGLETEDTEGTFKAVVDANSFVQPLEDGFEQTPSKELIERAILTSSIGKATPRVGLKSVSGALPVEFRASGIEGGETDFDEMLSSLLGTKTTIASQNTTKSSGNTASVLQIEDADIGDYTVGDILVVLEAGEHHPCAITARTAGAGTATITVVPALPSGAFSASVVIAKSVTHKAANSGQPTLSFSYFDANTKNRRAIGCRVNSLSVDSFETGQVASFNFGFEGLSFDLVDEVAPFTPTFDTGLPPIILQACVFQDDTQIDINNFTLSVDNEIGFQTSTCDADGRISSRFTNRTVTGSINPYMDDTSIANFNNFDGNTAFSLFISAFNPSAVAGEISLGSVVGIFLPNCITTEFVAGDQEGLLTDEITFQADRGSDGTDNEISIGFI